MLKINHQELIHCPEKNNLTKNKTCNCFVYTPEKIDQQNLGNLYIIGEVAETSPDQACYLVNLLASIIKREYYSYHKNCLEALESALHKANLALSDLFENLASSKATTNQKIKWLKSLHFLVAAFHKNKIYLANTNKTNTLFIRQGQLAEIKTDHKNRSNHPLKTFSNIAIGKLNLGDKLILTTPWLLNNLSREQIKQLAEKYDLSEFCSKINKLVSGQNSKKDGRIASSKTVQNLALLILEISSASTNKKKKGAKKTYALPSNQPKIYLEDLIDLSQQKSTHPKTIKPTSKKTLRNFVKVSKACFFCSAQKVNKICFPLFNRKRNNIFGKSIKNFYSLICSLSLIKKTAIISVISALLCSALFYYLWPKNDNFKEILLQHQSILKSAFEKEIQAEAVLIFNDRVKARNLLNQARELLNQLLNLEDLNKGLQKPEYSEKTAELKTTLEEQYYKIDKIKNIENIKTTDLPETMRGIFGIAEKIYTFNSDSIFFVNEKSQAKNIISITEKDSILEKGAVLDSEQVLIFINNKSELVIVDPNKKTYQNIHFKLPEDDISDISNYKSYIYLLDRQKKQIFKCPRILSGIGACNPWLSQSGQDILENPLSIAIDGEIYVLESSGRINKFLRGELQEFELSELSKPITNPLKILTSIDSAYIYIIEPSQKRVLVFNKDGELETQYIASEFSGIKDAWIGIRDRKIYLLGEKKIFEIEME